MQANVRRLVGLGCASAAATVALAAPATAAVLPHDPVNDPVRPAVAPPRHDVLGGAHFTNGSSSSAAPAGDGLSATELGYGVAGGVAVLAAAAAGVVALRHRPQLPRHA